METVVVWLLCVLCSSAAQPSVVSEFQSESPLTPSQDDMLAGFKSSPPQTASDLLSLLWRQYGVALLRSPVPPPAEWPLSRTRQYVQQGVHSSVLLEGARGRPPLSGK